MMYDEITEVISYMHTHNTTWIIGYVYIMFPASLTQISAK